MTDPHDIVWTDERIRRFWDFYGAGDAHEDTYFSKVRGRAIVDFVAERIAIGRALDVGCGRGDLIGFLLERHEAGGADQSPESVDTVNRKFGGEPHFQGATVGTLNLPDAMADTVFLIEVVEHLDDVTLHDVLTEAIRLIRPGGHLVVTTPNDENLDANKIMCPECACVWHRWQHVRSWTTTSLTERMATFGLKGAATATYLSPFSGPKRILQRHYHRLRRFKPPHMVYIGKRS